MEVRLPDGTVVKNVPPGTTQADLRARLAKARGTAPFRGTLGPLDQAIQESKPEGELDPGYERHPAKALEHSMRAIDVPFRALGNAVMDKFGNPIAATAAYALPQLIQPGAVIKIADRAVKLGKITKEAVPAFAEMLKKRIAEEGKTGWKKATSITDEEVDKIIAEMDKPKFPSKPIKTEAQKAGGKQRTIATPEEITGDPTAGNLDDVLPKVREGPRVGAMPDLPTQEFPTTTLPAETGLTVYHGTSHEFDPREFDISKSRDGLIHLTTDQSQAKLFATVSSKKTGKPSRVMEVSVDMKNPLDEVKNPAEAARMYREYQEHGGIAGWLEDNGYDGRIDMKKHVMVLDGKQISPIEPKPMGTKPVKPTREESFQEKYANFLGDAIKRFAMEERGQEILDDMVERGESVQSVAKRFWSDTYFKMPAAAQQRFQRMLKNLTGMEPGSAIAKNTKTGEVIRAKDWHDIAEILEFPESAEQLEGTERGLVALMKEANLRSEAFAQRGGGATEAKLIGRDEQGGKINPALATKLASTAAGAVIGAGLDPDDPIQGAVYGAAGGFLLGHTVSKRVITGGFGSALRVATNPGAALHNAKDAELRAGQRAASQTYEQIKAFKIPENRGMAVIRAMETGDFSALSPQENQAAQLFLAETGKLGIAAQEAGVIPRLKRNYVPLVFDWSDKKTAQTLREMGHKDTAGAERVGFSTFTPFQLERTIDDYGVAARLGLKPKTTNLHELFGLYANSVIKATENKRALLELQNLKDVTGRPLVSAGQAPKDWVPINKGDTRVPELDGFFVHPDIADSVRVGFASYDPDIVARSAMNVSWFAKRFNVSLSAFHPMALLQAYAGAGGNPLDVAAGMAARGAEKLTGGKVGIPYQSAIEKALGAYRSGGAGDQVDTLIRNGLKLEAPIEDRSGRDAFVKTMELAEKKAGELGASPAGIPFKAAKAVDSALQKFTWDYMYTGMKLNTGMRLLQREVERNMTAAAAGKEPLKPINQIAEDVSSFVNSTFGGLDLRRIAETVESEWGKKAARTAATPRGQAYLQMAVFAPDWKLSTLQSWTRGLGLTGNADLQRLHREYLVRSAFMSMVLADAINYKLSGHHVWQNDFHTKRGHEQTAMEKVHDATFVDLGDGRKMQMFKHLMEGPHAISDPQKFALNAMGYIPRTVGTLLTNKQFMTPDWAPPIAEGYLTPMQKAYRYGTWPLKQAVPIAGQQFDAGWGPTVGGFMGLPVYGMDEQQRERLRQKRVEDRAKALENR